MAARKGQQAKSATRAKPATLRKRYGKSSKKSSTPIVIGPGHHAYEALRRSFAEEPLSPEDSEAVLRWLDTGKGRPPCV